MSIKSSGSVFLVLVVSQVSCQLIKVSKVDKPDTFQDGIFKDVRENRITEAWDQETKNKIQQEIKDNPGFKYRGVLVSFGDKIEKPPTEKTSYTPSMVTCLEVNESVKFYPSYSSNKLYESKFHISFDFGKYADVDSYSQPKPGEKDERLCFLFGYSYPYKGSKDKTMHFYLNFLNDLTILVGKTIHSLRIVRTKKDSDIQFYNRKEPFDKQDANSLDFRYFVKINFSKCLISEDEELAFTLDGKKYSFSGERRFEMVFFKQGPEGTETDPALLESVKANPISRDETLKCVNNFVDIMLSKESKAEYLEKYAKKNVI